MMVWSVLGDSELRRITSGEQEGAVKVLTEFPEATEMAAETRSGLYWALSFGLKLSSIGIGGRFKSRLPQPNENGFLKQSQTALSM